MVVALAGPANKEGRIAADDAMGRATLFKGTLGTSITKVFDLSVAVTGLSEKRLLLSQMPYLTSYTHPGSHASYYPDSRVMSIKLLFSPCKRKNTWCSDRRMKGVDKKN